MRSRKRTSRKISIKTDTFIEALILRKLLLAVVLLVIKYADYSLI